MVEIPLLAYVEHRQWCGSLESFVCDCGLDEELDALGFTWDQVEEAKRALDEREGMAWED